ncbi:MAG: FixH family protein [Pseudomonadota bacterium]
MNHSTRPDRRVQGQVLPRPWWKEAYVWMVIAGPVSVIFACLVTAFYILQGPDAVVPESHYPEGVAMSQQLRAAQPPMQPALLGRNHSATGGEHEYKP